LSGGFLFRSFQHYSPGDKADFVATGRTADNAERGIEKKAHFSVLTRGKRKTTDSGYENGTTGHWNWFYRKYGSLFRVLTRAGAAKNQQVYGGKAF
jgi:hypothetical protein